MLYPQSNPCRQMMDLSGFWNFRFDPANEGDAQQWGAGFDPVEIIAVPASWNDQFEDWRDYLGTVWYQTTFDLSWGWQGQRILVRFNAVSYLAEVWLNGERLGQHEGGYLPFVFDITDQVKDTGNVLVARVDGQLAPDRVPPGNLAGLSGAAFPTVNYPDTSFDFFPYCGIQRPVLIYTEPPDAITDLTVSTGIEGANGVVQVQIERTPGDPLVGRITLTGHGAVLSADLDLAGESGEVVLTVPDAALWLPDAPNLYDLRVELRRDGAVVDCYTLAIGIRTIAVEGDQLLLNGEPVKLLGFGRHEDFPVVGKGLLPALIIKDYALMRWIGANSFRTSHYPYSEQMMDMADRLGFMVIDETPAVGLFFMGMGLEKRNKLCQQMIREMIDRDKNHPSVIMWSVANEPHTARLEAREAYYRDFTVIKNPSRPEAVESFKAQVELVRELDPTRPVTLVSHEGALEESFAFVDVTCLNRYHGWYSFSGQIDQGLQALDQEIELIYKLYPKPFLLSEFGTDTIPGHHAQPPEMFSEEYQAEFLTKQIRLTDAKPFVIGQHIWNLCDFKTGQAVQRMAAYNYKGVFTRDRRPKLAAHRVRALWRGEDAP
ncbi:MAG: beta-glucuronidase [Anaerolineae bacterium]|nr:beta-glucuronidase [Anaerolineae bacterium]